MKTSLIIQLALPLAFIAELVYLCFLWKPKEGQKPIQSGAVWLFILTALALFIFEFGEAILLFVRYCFSGPWEGLIGLFVLLVGSFLLRIILGKW